MRSTAGLKYNLGGLTLEQQVNSTRGARRRSLTGLLPTVQGRTDETRETVNLAGLGFDASVFPGVHALVGPFTVFDARLGGRAAGRGDQCPERCAKGGSQLGRREARLTRRPRRRGSEGVVDLANAELAQAQTRFRAGVTSNLEVVQA